jgi:hypothetical protein
METAACWAFRMSETRPDNRRNKTVIILEAGSTVIVALDT